MAFFKREHKKLALNSSASFLHSRYKATEENLIKASNTGNEKNIRRAMKEHGKYEYAMLYKNTPEYRKKRGIK